MSTGETNRENENKGKGDFVSFQGIFDQIPYFKTL